MAMLGSVNYTGPIIRNAFMAIEKGSLHPVWESRKLAYYAYAKLWTNYTIQEKSAEILSSLG